MSLVRVEIGDRVARVTLDDPGRRNVLSGALVGELIEAFDKLERRDDVTAVVLTGAGPAFCAGADLADLLAAADGDPKGVQRVYSGFDRVRRSPLMTIAAVNGPAVGAGLNLALVCDVRVAAAAAWFDCRFLTIGLHPGGGHLQMLDRLVGRQTAAAMVLCGQRLDAARAREVGLVLAAVPDVALLATAEALARRAAEAERDLVLLTKRSLYEEAAMSPEEAMVVEAERQLWSLSLPVTADGLRSAAARTVNPDPHRDK